MPIQDRLTAMVGGKTSEEKKKIVSKSTIAERLDAVVHETTPPTNHDELSSLTEQYQQLRKQLSALVKALKKYSEMTEKMHKARDQAIAKLAQLSLKSPLGDDIGLPLDKPAGEALETIRNDSKINSQTIKEDVLDIAGVWETRNPDLKSSFRIVQRLASTQAIVDTRDFQLHVLDYATEWEIVVNQKVDRGLQKVKKMASDRKHYKQKTGKLNKQVSEQKSKGKGVKQDLLDKLKRNETKCKEAVKVHEWEEGRLIVLLDTAINDGWEDLYHLAMNLMRWEADRVAGETDVYSPLGRIMDSIEIIYQDREAFKQQVKESGGKTKKKGKKKKGATDEDSHDDISGDEHDFDFTDDEGGIDSEEIVHEAFSDRDDSSDEASS